MGSNSNISFVGDIDSGVISVSRNKEGIREVITLTDVVGFPGYSGYGTISLDVVPPILTCVCHSNVDNRNSHVQTHRLETYTRESPFPLSSVSHILIKQIASLAMC